MMIEFIIPPPPSTNNLYLNARGRGRIKTPVYRDWITQATIVVRAQLRPTAQITGRFQLSIWLPPGLDLDNIKAIADLIGPGKSGMGLTEDDRKMVELHVWRTSSATAQCRVQIMAIEA